MGPDDINDFDTWLYRSERRHVLRARRLPFDHLCGDF